MEDNEKMMEGFKTKDNAARRRTSSDPNGSDDSSIPKEGQTTKSEQWSENMPDRIVDNLAPTPTADTSSAAHQARDAVKEKTPTSEPAGAPAGL